MEVTHDRIAVNPYEKDFDQRYFHVVTMISNPMRFTRRYELFLQFREYMKKQGVYIWVAEVQDGNRPFVCTDPSNPRDLQLRCETQIWVKENALNLAIQRFPSDWKYVAWIDADIEFLRNDWMQETIHELQMHKVVQMWSTAVDLDSYGNVLSDKVSQSFMSKYAKSGYVFPEKWIKDPKKFGQYQAIEWHPGFAWAATREAINGMGLLMDRAVVGAGDRHMALALVGMAEHSFHPQAPAAYKKYVLDWQERCQVHIRKNVGYVDGMIYHKFHGRKSLRNYYGRWQIINGNDYDPFYDLRTNYQGVLELDDYAKPKLRDQIRHYFSTRNEDSIDLE